MSFDQPAVFIHHVPRLLLPSFLREFEQGAMQFVLGRDELLERRDADHALHEPPVLSPERMAVERVPQQAYGDESEPPAREVQQEGIGAIDRDHLLRGVGTLEGAEVRVFIRPNVRPICGIEASSRAIAKRRAALICVFSPPLNSATSCHWPSTPWTRMRIPWPRPSSYVSSRIRPKRLSVSSERFFDASISSSGRS